MKQWKKIILFSVLLVLLVGALIFSMLYKNKDAENNVTPTPTIDPVVAIAEKDIEKITVENSFGTLVFSSAVETTSGVDAVEWNLSSPQNPKYNKDTIGGKIAYYTQIEAESVISSPSANLAEYGLDKPVATILIALKSGEKKKILYGNKTAAVGSQYVMVEGSGRVCTTTISNADAAMLKSMDFLDTDVLNGFTVAEAKTIEFKRAKDHLDFTATSNNDASADGQVPATWQVNTPIPSPANGDGFQTLLTELVSIKAITYVELSPKDLSKYGLDVPSYDITLTSDSKKVHCILGKSSGDGYVYGYSDYTDAVFTVSIASLTSIDKPFLELVSAFISVLSNIWDVKAVDISIDGLAIHCDVKDDKDKAAASDFKVNGQDANVKNSSDSSYFRTFYQSLIGIRIDDLDLAATPAYNPVITIDYTKTDNSTIKIGFVKRDDITYYVFIDGTYQKFYTSKDSFYSEKKGYEGVLPAYRILENAMKNQVNGVYQ